MRRHVIDLAGELGVTVEQRSLSRAELHLADEIFITSSSRDALPITRIEGQRVAGGKPGPLTMQILAELRGAVSCRRDDCAGEPEDRAASVEFERT